jgi:ATP-dependent RNA helicase RhlE
LPHVVNYDLPNVPEDYVHRIGRTGRAGAMGEAISLVCVDEHEFLRDIERLLKRQIPEEVIAGFEPDPRARAQPILQRQGRGQSQGRGAASGQQRRAPAAGHGGRGQPRNAPAAHGLQAGGKSRHAPVASPPRHGARNGTSARAHVPKAMPAFRSGTRDR